MAYLGKIRLGVLGLAGEPTRDRESRFWLPTYLYITPVGFQILGFDMDKLEETKLARAPSVS